MFADKPGFIAWQMLLALVPDPLRRSIGYADADSGKAGFELAFRPGSPEWQDTPGGEQPWYFAARDGSPALTVAGLWDEWKDRETGLLLKSCTMIITVPNDFVAEVHDRMP